MSGSDPMDRIVDDPWQAVIEQVATEDHDGVWEPIARAEERHKAMLEYLVREYGDEPEVQAALIEIALGGYGAILARALGYGPRERERHCPDPRCLWCNPVGPQRGPGRAT